MMNFYYKVSNKHSESGIPTQNRCHIEILITAWVNSKSNVIFAHDKIQPCLTIIIIQFAQNTHSFKAPIIKFTYTLFKFKIHFLLVCCLGLPLSSDFYIKHFGTHNAYVRTYSCLLSSKYVSPCITVSF